MRDAKSLWLWMTQWGYSWVEGQERIYKAQLTWLEAQGLIEELQAEGAIKWNGN